MNKLMGLLVFACLTALVGVAYYGVWQLNGLGFIGLNAVIFIGIILWIEYMEVEGKWFPRGERILSCITLIALAILAPLFLIGISVVWAYSKLKALWHNSWKAPVPAQ